MDQIRYAIDYVYDGSTPYFPEQIISEAYNLSFKTGIFYENFKLWRIKPEFQKTWETSKTYFDRSHQYLRGPKYTEKPVG